MGRTRWAQAERERIGKSALIRKALAAYLTPHSGTAR